MKFSNHDERMYSQYNEEWFKDSVREAQKTVQRLLDIDRSPNLRLAEEVDHVYTDKYELANLLTNTAIISLVTVLDCLGLTKEVLQRMDANASKATTIRLGACQSCTFATEESVDIALPISKETKDTTTVSKDFGTDESVTTKSTIETIVKRVTRQHYTIDKEWQISIYFSTDVENRWVIQERKNASFDFVRDIPHDTKSAECQEPPFPAKSDIDPIDLSLTWLLEQIDTKELKSHFAVDTSPTNTKTKTPKQNVEIGKALDFFSDVNEWTLLVHALFADDYPRTIHSGKGSGEEKSLARGLEQLDSRSVFVPIIPLLEDRPSDVEVAIQNESTSGRDDPEAKAILSLAPTTKHIESDSMTRSPLLSTADTTAFLNEHIRTLAEVQTKLNQQYPNPETSTKLVSSAEAYLCVICLHTRQLVDRYTESINYIEQMLEKQLITAMNKRVNGADLEKFMKYHNDKMLSPSPVPFCYSIRRPNHYPDGIISIEAARGDHSALMEPIFTHVREVPCSSTKIPLNAATTVELTGKTYLHGWLNHQFGLSFSELPRVRLNARARQFSSFILLVGTMMSDSRMQPKDAIILRNKDELQIPLLLNELPTATEFKDAISSLSPQQQRFARAFRAMQLESSVLGICVIQIKPQLERLLNLPPNSLTKEMKLTEDLTELFVEYQVSSDLVSYDELGSTNTDQSARDKVSSVKEHVKAILSVIDEQKKEQLSEQHMKANMAWNRTLETSDDKDDDDDECDEEMSAEVFSISAMSQPVRKISRRLLGAKKAVGPLQCAYKLPNVPTRPPETDAYATVDIVSNQDHPGGERGEEYDLGSENKVPELSSNIPGSKVSDTGDMPNIAVLDFTAVPKILDNAIEFNDKEASIRSTTIELAKDGWNRNRQPNLLTMHETTSLSAIEIKSETNKAFDLLDALSRSGSLDIAFSELHVLVCATHRFEKSVIETVIQDNINPIEKLEMSTLLMASTILDVPAKDLVRNEKKRKLLAQSFPRLIADEANGIDSPARSTTSETTRSEI